MSKPAPRLITVTNSELLTTNMQRISFKADDISDFDTDNKGGYIKLLFNDNGGTDISAIAKGTRPKMRTYTIRNLRLKQNEFDIDFVRHDHTQECDSSAQGGFASHWSQHAQIGDQISMVGPGEIKGLNSQADWFFLVADMTALPALSEKLQVLPATAAGYAVIEINHESDQQALVKPQGIEVVWLIKSEQQDDNNDLVSTVRAQQWNAGRVAVWSACEFEQMRGLRSYFRNEKQIIKDDIYLSSYWKQGCTEDGHKLAKKKDKEA